MKLAIGIPAQGNIRIETMLSLIHSLRSIQQHVITFIVRKGTYLHQQRNDIVEDARSVGADYLMFIDTDITFPEYGIQRLIELNKDICGGVYNMKVLPPVSTLKMAGEDGKPAEIKQFEMPKEPFTCYAIPSGFMLVKLSAIKEIEHPFEFGYDENGIVGEDVMFCSKAREKGLEIWCDPTIPIGHIGEYVY